MSLLTEVSVVVSTMPSRDLCEALTRQIDPGDHREQRLAKLDTSGAGGNKVYCSGLFAAMLNYVAPEAVVEFLDAIAWQYHEAVVIIDHEGDDLQVLRYPKEMTDG